MRLDADLNGMLEELAVDGSRPVVHQASAGTGWVAYAQGPVRAFFVGEGPDPESAVRALYVHTFKHPNIPPPTYETPYPAAVKAAAGSTVSVRMRPSRELCEALHAMAAGARSALPRLSEGTGAEKNPTIR